MKRILVHTAEYLAGQALAGETFTNDGRTGAEHMAAAREKILRWIDLHGVYQFEHEGQSLTLDFEKSLRVVQGE